MTDLALSPAPPAASQTDDVAAHALMRVAMILAGDDADAVHVSVMSVDQLIEHTVNAAARAACEIERADHGLISGTDWHVSRAEHRLAYADWPLLTATVKQ